MDYLTDRFARFGKEIGAAEAERLAGLVEDHSHYVQQLGQVAFGLSAPTCTAEVVETAFRQLIGQLEPFFSQQVAPLTQTQLGFLRAVLDGREALSSREVRDEYRLGASANVAKLKTAMPEREFVQLDREGRFEFVDPVFAAWLRIRL